MVPAWLVLLCFFVAAGCAIAAMAWITWRGNKPTAFFLEEMSTTYDLNLPLAEINGYTELRDRIHQQFLEQQAKSPQHQAAAEEGADEGAEAQAEPWVRSLEPEKKGVLYKALRLRLLKDLDSLNQVQRDKPTHARLWHQKLVSEQYWNSLLDAERIISEEIDECLADAEELEPGARERLLPQAIQQWRMTKERQMFIEQAIAAKEKEKTDKEEAEKKAEKEAKQKKAMEEKRAAKLMEELLREEEKAAVKGKKAKESTKPTSRKVKKK